MRPWDYFTDVHLIESGRMARAAQDSRAVSVALAIASAVTMTIAVGVAMAVAVVDMTDAEEAVERHIK